MLLPLVQVRLEELETRITQLNGELAKLLRLKLKVEAGLRDMERMGSVEDLKVQGKRLWYDCCKCLIATDEHWPTSANRHVTEMLRQIL